jgi:hypothetical protein
MAKLGERERERERESWNDSENTIKGWIATKIAYFLKICQK